MWRRIVRWGGGLLIAFAAIQLLVTVAVRTKFPPFINAMRRLNRSMINPRMMERAGKAGSYAAVIRHRGRNTGAPYATPVLAEPTDEGFVVPLPYGTHVDWLKNVLASGEAAIEHDGTTYSVDHPELIPSAVAEPHVPAEFQERLRFYGVDHYLRVRIAVDEPAGDRTTVSV